MTVRPWIILALVPLVSGCISSGTVTPELLSTEPAPTACLVRGAVVDATDFAPIAGVIVEALGPVPRAQTTTGDGLFHFTDLTEGAYEVLASQGDRILGRDRAECQDGAPASLV